MELAAALERPGVVQKAADQARPKLSNSFSLRRAAADMSQISADVGKLPPGLSRAAAVTIAEHRAAGGAEAECLSRRVRPEPDFWYRTARGRGVAEVGVGSFQDPSAVEAASSRGRVEVDLRTR